ncbi:NAD dependent epimerase/dehydratase family protein [Klosneuvirus KNV1]|uniref:NAD dependent epimerase/dehydratase family protein n=1 Tax=Klosneuvirus KNV1 TaxID=1977640 RepID=A0A1V0SL94_9VIRU|nr:NAD dependent epimerase/dehydratase family protein [Klosneuvirus KNV1]
MKFLVYGAKGWIGTMCVELLHKTGEEVIEAKSRADDEEAVEKELLEVKPDRVMSFIGRTHGGSINTIDYLEQPGKLIENLTDNLYAPFVLAMLCTKHGIFYSYLGTGCIYSCKENEYGDGYMDDEKPDFFGSQYSVVKGITHRMLGMFKDNVLSLKIRMPCSDLPGPRNFITKITKYEKVCSIANSITSLPTMLPIMIDMTKKKVSGIFNMVNPVPITHNEILEMYREIIDPSFSWKNFTLEEQSKVLQAGRSNNKLNTDKLLSMYPNIPNAKDDIRNLLYEMKKQMNK